MICALNKMNLIGGRFSGLRTKCTCRGCLNFLNMVTLYFINSNVVFVKGISEMLGRAHVHLYLVFSCSHCTC